MPTTTTIKSARILPSWEVRIEKLLQRNVGGKDRCEFVSNAVADHVTSWLYTHPKHPRRSNGIIIAARSLIDMQHNNRQIVGIEQLFARMLTATMHLQDDPQLATNLVTEVKALIDAYPDDALNSPFFTHFGTHSINHPLYDTLSGVSLRPSDALEEAEAKKAKQERGDSIDPDSFIQPTQDSHGHSAAVSCRIPLILDSAIDAIVGTRAFPYDTSSDLLRHAIARAIVSQEVEPSLWALGNQILAIEHVLREWETRLDADSDFFALVQQAVDHYTKKKDSAQVYITCLTAQTHIAFGEDPLWKKRQQREFDSGFGHLIAGRGIDPNPSHS